MPVFRIQNTTKPSFKIQNTSITESVNSVLYEHIQPPTGPAFCNLTSSSNSIDVTGHGNSGSYSGVLIEMDTISSQENFSFVSDAPYTVSTSIPGYYQVTWSFSGVLSSSSGPISYAYISTLNNGAISPYGCAFRFDNTSNPKNVTVSAIVQLTGLDDGLQFYLNGLPTSPSPYLNLTSTQATITKI
jgi:hypothetical protein